MFFRGVSGVIIKCPSCNEIVYAYSEQRNDNVTVRCSVCYNVFNVDQVVILAFPDEEIVVTSFADIVGRDIGDKAKALVEYLSRSGVELYYVWDLDTRRLAPLYHAVQHGVGDVEEAMERLAPAVRNGYRVIEVLGMEDNVSVFVAVRPDSSSRLREALSQYTCNGYVWEE